MTALNKRKIQREPSLPGEVLKELWLDENEISQQEFAELLLKHSSKPIKKSTLQTKLNELIKGKRSLSADFAILIGRATNTNARMWMNLQVNADLWRAERELESA